MKKYEFSFIISPTVEGEEVKNIVEKYSKVLTSNGANVTRTDDMGVRELAYEIKDFTKGHYFVFEAESNNDANLEFDRLAKIDENILRHICINLEN